MQIKCKDYHILPSQARARFVTRCLRHNPSQERMISPAPPYGFSCPLLPYGLSTYASQATVNPIKSSEDCRKTTTNQPGIEQIPIPTLQTSFPGGEGKGALVSSKHRTCLSMKDRCNHQCFLVFTNLSINELTRSFYSHNMTIQFTSKPTKLMTQKKYLVYKCQTPGRGSAGPECSLLGPLRGSSISHISPWSQPVSNRFLNRAVLAEGFARPPELFS